MLIPHPSCPFLGPHRPLPVSVASPPHELWPAVIAESFCWIAVVVWGGACSAFSLWSNQIGDAMVLAMMKTVKDAVKHTPTAVELWQTFRFYPTLACYHQLCRPRSQLAVYTVLCVDARSTSNRIPPRFPGLRISRRNSGISPYPS